MSRANSLTAIKRKRGNVFLRLLGPGLVTGAADDDPSGIATYSQAGAQFGFGLLWTVFLTTPFMIALSFFSILGKQAIEQDHVSGKLFDFTLASIVGALCACDE